MSLPMITKRKDFGQIWDVSTPHTIVHHGDGVCSYTGPGDLTEDSIGTVRGRVPLDPLGPPHSRSFELYIIEPGQHKYIAIGVCSAAYPKNMLPGWEETSVGYHADNGNLFHSCGDGQPTDNPCHRGDIMRCTVEPVDGSTKQVRVLFHRNDQLVGQITAWTPEKGFFPSFGMMSKNEKVQVVLPEISIPYSPLKMQFHDIWEVTNPNLQYQENGICSYVGPGGPDHVGTIRSKLPLNPQGPHNTFEVKIINPGEKCYIALGVCSKTYPTYLLPGWEDISIGFHMDNGLILQSSAGEQQTSHPCRKGDVVRCTSEPVDGSSKQVSIVFHRNGSFVGKTIVWTPAEGFYAQISAMGIREVIQIASPQMDPSFLKHDSVEVMGMPLGAEGQPMRSKQPSRELSEEGETKHMETYMEGQACSPGAMVQSGVHPAELMMHPAMYHAYMMKMKHLHHSHAHHGFPHPYFHPYPPRYGGSPMLHPRTPSPYFIPVSHSEAESASHLPFTHARPPFHRHTPSPHSGSSSSLPFYDPSSRPPSYDPSSYDPSSGLPSYDPSSGLPPYDPPSGLPPYDPSSGLPPYDPSSGLPPYNPRMASSPIFAAQASVSSTASDLEAFHSQSSVESAEGYGHRPPSKSNSYPTMSTGLHESGNYSSQVSGHDIQGGQVTTPSEEPSSLESSHKVEYEKGSRLLPEGMQQCSSIPHTMPPEDGMRKRAPSPFAPDSEIQRSPSPFPTEGTQKHSISPLPPEVPSEPSKGHKTEDLIGEDFPDSPPRKRDPVIYSLQEEDSSKMKAPAVIVETPVRVIPKEENKMFSILHNVGLKEDGSIECSQSSESAFVMCRLPLTEKISYFEVEIQHLGDGSSGNVASGLVWSRYPHFMLPGVLGGSVAFYSCDGSVYTGGPECKSAAPPCAVGDVIGCRAHLWYKSEASNPGSSGTVEVEFFKNGCLVGKETVLLPPSGFHPAVGLVGSGTRAKVNYNITLTPDSYFQSHPLPESHLNFIPPPAITDTWNCLQNSSVSEDNYVSLKKANTGEPAVVQSCLPFTEVTQYFEADLLKPISTYSVVSIGILPRVSADSKRIIPGEAPNSVSFLPLLGFVMRNGVISCPIRDFVTYSDKTTIGVGIDFHPPSGSSTSLSEKVNVFFTVNSQQVNCILTNLPDGGFYPTIVIDSDCKEDSKQLMAVYFPKPLPCTKELPYGFIRGPPDPSTFEVIQPVWLRDAKGAEETSSECAVRAIQAAFPLSTSKTYFEIQITHGGANFCISVGLASFNYPLDIHPGWGKDSIAFHADDGNLFLNSVHEMVASPCKYRGAVIGCGARFPGDGSTKNAEVFFTINRKMIAKRFVPIPPLGLFPTIGLRTEGAIISINLDAPDPFPDMRFNTMFVSLENIEAEGSTVQLISTSQPGAARLVSLEEIRYFRVSPISEVKGKIFLGYSTTKEDPFISKCEEGMKSYCLDIASGMVIIHDQFFKVNEACAAQGGHYFGCGLQPIPSSKKSLLFFTMDAQVVYCSAVDISRFEKKLHPSVFMIGSNTKVSVDACSLWPPVSPLGKGWARHANLMRENSKIIHNSKKSVCKIPVGFAQAAMPLTPYNPYFEVEVCSRAIDKAIAIGLASRRYPSNTWVGWKNDSIAYHLDDGKLFKGSGNFGHNFGPKVFAGHTVGCGVRFGATDHTLVIKGGERVEVFFTLNGAIVSSQKALMKMTPCGGFFPTICLESPQESVICHWRSQFPPLSSLVSREWANTYSIHQAGRLLEHSCRHRELTGGVTKAFCQAKEPLSPERPYFEIEIVGMGDSSQVSAGAAKLVPVGSTVLNVDSVMYCCTGQLVTRKGSQKSTNSAQKCSTGDKLGCALVFQGGKPTAVDFFLNSMKVIHCDGVLLGWGDEPLYPTIMLSNPRDTVVPSLGLPLPEWDRSMMMGWLRSERVKLRNSVVEYTGTGGTASDVGVAQVSQPLQIESHSYYEVEILDPGESLTIGVGAASADYSLNSQPGWRANSVGYHGDDGHLFHANGLGASFGPKWKKHDIIGLGIRSPTGTCDPGSEVHIYFTRNGTEIGHTTVTVPPSGLFPTVGFHSPHEKVKVQASIPNTTKRARLSWRTLCGVKIQSSSNGSHTLEYWDNGRDVPTCGIKLATGIANQRFSDSMQYFEIQIKSYGLLRAVAIGVVPKDYSVEHAPGWLEGSIAYHTDTGHLHYNHGRGKVFGPVPQKGDTIGCGVTFVPNNSKHCFVFFTYNGMEIGRSRAAIPEGGLFPAVCLTAKKDKVVVSFHESFKPKLPQSDLAFVGLMRINNCSYSDQIVHFTGSSGSSGGGQAPAMAQFAIPLHRDRNYFSASIVKCDNNILIGLAVRDYPLKYAPGYTSISVAYDVIKGSIRAVYSSDNFHSFDAPKCEIGDIVGCGIEEVTDSKTDHGYVYFTKNRKIVRKVQLVELFEDFYPIVGMIPNRGLPAAALFMHWNPPIFEPQNVL